MSKLRVAILFGGVSSEHDISLKSAAFVIRNLPSSRFETICIGITKSGRWLYYPGDVESIESGTWKDHPDCAAAVISPDRSHRGILKIMDDGSYSLLKIDCVFPVLHGKNGEDGTVQGLLSLAGIPYVGCDTLSSAACMDKAVTHTILDAAGIKTASYCTVARTDIPRLDSYAEGIAETLGFPIFVKPANAGSSVGVNKADDLDGLKKAIKIAFTHDSKAVCETAIVGAEVECAVLGNDDPKASIVGEIASANEFYDFESKYVSAESKLYIPARLADETSERIRSIAVAAYKALGCSGLARVDFFAEENGGIILNEINTLPGFTAISMYPKLWEKCGKDSKELLGELVELALERADY